MSSPFLYRILVVVLCAALVSGCVLGRQTTPVSIIAPVVELEPGADWPEAAWTLQVQRPVSDQMRDSNRILVREARSQLKVYPGAAWLDAAPDMFQALLVQALEDSGRFEGVSRPGGAAGRYRLRTEMRRFEALDDGSRDLAADIEIRASLIHTRSARVVAARTFEQRTRADGGGLQPLVSAFEDAFQQLVTGIAEWVLVSAEEAEADRGDEDLPAEEQRRWPRGT